MFVYENYYIYIYFAGGSNISSSAENLLGDDKEMEDVEVEEEEPRDGRHLCTCGV